MSEWNREQAETWANRELDLDENGNRIPRLADCDWPKEPPCALLVGES
jgi:hypothetical protein